MSSNRAAAAASAKKSVSWAGDRDGSEAGVGDVETLLAGDFQKLFVKWANRASALRMNSESPTRIDTIIVFIRITPRPHQQEEIALVFFAE
jgi:hypothetical protein